MDEALIRPYRPADRDALYAICLRTADSGADATALYRDPDLVGDVFAGPYPVLEPDLSFVLQTGDRVTGYVVGTADAARFAERMRREWLPLVGARNPAPTGPPATVDERMARLLHHPEGMVRPELAGHPAHLHINLLPEAQGAGHGRRLIATMLGALRGRGVERLCLGVRTGNTRALGFYRRLGFYPIDVPNDDGMAFFGRRTEVSW